MKRLSAKLRHKTISQLTALFLCFWISGAICAVLCHQAGAKVLAVENRRETRETVQKTVSCPMHQQAAERSGENSQTTANSFVPQRQDAPDISCCPFTSFFTNTPQKINQTDVAVFVAAAPLKFDFAVSFKQREIPLEINYQTVPRTRGDTYLRNCVFLI